MSDALGIIAAAGVGLSAWLERYRATTQGPNPWTLDGICNVLAHSHLFDKVRALVDGRVTSAFRCREVNAAVGGSPTSDHLAGRAVDVVPAVLSCHDAAAAIYAAAVRGELGNVREVLEEPSCVHVGWYPLDAPHAAPRLGKWRM